MISIIHSKASTLQFRFPQGSNNVPEITRFQESSRFQQGSGRVPGRFQQGSRAQRWTPKRFSVENKPPFQSIIIHFMETSARHKGVKKADKTGCMLQGSKKLGALPDLKNHVRYRSQ